MSTFYDSVGPTDNQAKENKLVRKALTRLPEPFLSGLKLNQDISLYRYDEKTDTATELILNTIDDNDVVWIASDIEGWWTLPEPEVPDLPRGWGDGSYDAIGRWTNRIMTLVGSFLPQRPEDAPAARDKLLDALSVMVKTKSSGYLIVTDFDQPIQIYDAQEQADPRTVVFTTPNVSGIAPGDYVRVSGIKYDTEIQPNAANNFNSTASGFLVTAVEPGGIGVAPSVTIDRGEKLGNYTGGAFPGGGTIKKIVVRISAKVRLSGAPQITSVNARGRHDFSIGLRAVDPVKYEFVSGDPDGYRVIPVTPINGSASVSVFNYGNTAVPIIIELSSGFEVANSNIGSCPRIENFPQVIDIIKGTDPDVRLEIDTYNREVLKVTYDGEDVELVENGRASIPVIVDWIYLEPENNTLTFARFPAGSSCNIYYKSGWIG
jgi:hypothetical protein